jgi:hypothetical protein
VLKASAMRAALLVILGLAACGDTHTVTGYASADSYQTEITDCIQGHECSHLCIDVIKVPQSILDESRILKHDQYGAKFACEVSTSNPHFPGALLDDAISWDGDDDNSCDDCDDASGDPGDGDDNSGNDNTGNGTTSTDDSTASSSDSSDSSDSDDDCSTSGGTTWFCAFAALGVVALRRRS